MKNLPLAALTGFTALASLFIGTASAASPNPAGEWRVADGGATVRIEKCGSYYCGFVASATDPGKDIRNPDPAKRNRNVLGIEILFNLKADGASGFAGETYNADDGQIYLATVTPLGDTLKIRGCVPNGGMCGSETWTLVHK
ncbi:MAG: DUF2147 domain-containing protein [Beijerinckiaceae bacterium]|jgi:uncharacterized protein (DUF2147 family)